MVPWVNLMIPVLAAPACACMVISTGDINLAGWCNQHRITITKETIVTGDSMTVGFQHFSRPTKADTSISNELLRQMKISEQSIHHLKSKTFPYEDVGITSKWTKCLVIPMDCLHLSRKTWGIECKRFERTSHGGSTSKHSSAVAFTLKNRNQGLRWNRIPF